VDRPLLGVNGLRNATQKHCHSGNVLASLSKQWGIIPFIHDVALDLAGAAYRITHTLHNVLRRVHRRRWRLILLPLL
jgi:hypothetical protein